MGSNSTGNFPPAVFMGAANMDLITYTSRFAAPSETITADRLEKHLGGKATNVCITAARLGMPTAMICKVGQDDFAKDFFLNWKSHGVDTTGVTVVKDEKIKSGVALIVVSAAERTNSIYYIPGAVDHLEERDIDEASNKLFHATGTFVSTFECQPNVLIRALRLAKGKGMTTFVNPSPAFPSGTTMSEIYRLTDYLVLNEVEASCLTEENDIDSIEGCKRAICKLLQQGIDTVILTRGEKSTVFASSRNPVPGQVAAQKVSPVLDTTGAGDCFLGSVVYFHVTHPHLPLAERISRANYVAADSVTRKGAQTSYAYRSQLPSHLFSDHH